MSIRKAYCLTMNVRSLYTAMLALIHEGISWSYGVMQWTHKSSLASEGWQKDGVSREMRTWS